MIVEQWPHVAAEKNGLGGGREDNGEALGTRFQEAKLNCKRKRSQE